MENASTNPQIPSVDLRLIFQASATYLSVIGLLLNAFLIYLIFFKTPKKVCDYKIILIQNCFVDVLFNVTNEIGKGVSSEFIEFDQIWRIWRNPTVFHR